METTKIKKFAIDARNVLTRGIKAKLILLGFDEKGQYKGGVTAVQGGGVWNGIIVSKTFADQLCALVEQIVRSGVKQTCEQAAYTWFNRLMAIRILQKNGLCEPVLDFDDQARTPRIVNEARRGNMPKTDPSAMTGLRTLMEDDTRVTEQFGALVTAWCHGNAIINSCFGRMADWTELLLPIDILSEGGFVDMINSTEFITDDDYRSPELIGWLYQFYISERKAEVFKKKEKYTADEIPAATQIFTPNWIVKYMVQNSIGRIYIDNNPWMADELSAKWRYLVRPSEKTAEDNVCQCEELTDLKVADLACGSGHILNECFDLLYELYIEEGYSRRQAIESILRRNLIGIDIDERAKQLAQFALLLKACQRDLGFADAHCLPRVMDMPECNAYSLLDTADRLAADCALTIDGDAREELETVFTLMKDARTLGSIMKFNVSDATKKLITGLISETERRGLDLPEYGLLCRCLELVLALTDKYHAVVMNPPYMGGGKMNDVLSSYVKKNYAEGKEDLCTVFVQCASQHTAINGKYAFIIPPSWLFLSTFETLRENIIDHQTIDSLLHLSRGVFGADFGSSSCVITNIKTDNPSGTYFRLVERTFQEFEQSHLRMLFEQTLDNHGFKYCFKDYNKDVTELPYSDSGNRVYYPNVLQANFKKIPGCPVGYWVSDRMIEVFSSNLALSTVCKPTQGLATADNARFLRLWFEVNLEKIGFHNASSEEARFSGKKWFHTTKGGSFRRWYGNISYIVNWENNGEEMKNYKRSVIRNEWRYFSKDGSTWSTISSGKPSFRYFSKNWLFETKGSVCFPEDVNDNTFIIGYLNSKIVYSLLKVLSPTLDYHEGPMGRVPFMQPKSEDRLPIELLVRQNINLSKQDWDSHETSWDFTENELVRRITPECDTVEKCLEAYKAEWERKFMQLHANEEELNRQFIDIYGLEDELTPDVPLDEVTILQQGEISIENT